MSPGLWLEVRIEDRGSGINSHFPFARLHFSFAILAGSQTQEWQMKNVIWQMENDSRSYPDCRMIRADFRFPFDIWHLSLKKKSFGQ
jgi:hypothetical protein